MIVLDASAVLALAFHEPGWLRVGEVVDRASMSTINLAEVLSHLSDRPGLAVELPGRLHRLGLRIEPFTVEHAAIAAALRPATRHLGLSLGDRACLALARCLRATVLTADRAWRDLDIGVEVELIR